jgi:hypothetical protein
MQIISITNDLQFYTYNNFKTIYYAVFLPRLPGKKLYDTMSWQVELYNTSTVLMKSRIK